MTAAAAVLWIRSVAFAAAFYSWTILLAVLAAPVLVLPRRHTVRVARIWMRGNLLLARLIAGIRMRVTGWEHVPASGPVLIAAKHQSAWDTMVFHLLMEDPVYVHKHELLQTPFVGPYIRRLAMVAVDRSAGTAALRQMVDGAGAALRNGRTVVIFPEGTRVAPGTAEKWRPGIVEVHRRCPDVPVIPVALNSGLFWPRGSLLRRPGAITVQFLPPAEPATDRRAFLEDLKKRIETATRALEADAGAAG